MDKFGRESIGKSEHGVIFWKFFDLFKYKLVEIRQTDAHLGKELPYVVVNDINNGRSELITRRNTQVFLPSVVIADDIEKEQERIRNKLTHVFRRERFQLLVRKIFDFRLKTIFKYGVDNRANQLATELFLIGIIHVADNLAAVHEPMLQTRNEIADNLKHMNILLNYDLR